MARELLATEPVFRATFTDCASELRRFCDLSLLDELAAPEGSATGGSARWEIVDVIQPLLIAYQMALGDLLLSWGSIPDRVLGHSVGDVAAAYLSGALDLGDTARVIARYCAAHAHIDGRGGMGVVALSAAEAERRLSDRATLCVAGENGSCSTLVGGDNQELDAFLARMVDDGVFAQRVDISVAAHTSHCEPFLDELRESLVGLRPRPARIPFISTVTGEELSGVSLDAEYWARSLRHRVLLYPAVRRLLAEGPHHFVEIGPHPVLTPSLRQDVAEVAGAAAWAGPRRDSELGGLVELVQTLSAAGHRLHRHAGPGNDSSSVSSTPVEGVHTTELAAELIPNELAPDLPTLRTPSLREHLAALPEARRLEVLREVLREEVAGVLGIDARTIEVEQPLLHQGLDSLGAFAVRERLLVRLEADLPPALVLTHPTVDAIAEQLLVHAQGEAILPPPLPPLMARPEAAGEPFPLMPIQEAYWLGRRALLPLGGVGCHAYVELDLRGLDPARLQRALDEVIARHSSLRSVVQPDGYQRVLADLPRYECPHHDLRELDDADVATRTLELRDRLAHRVYDPQRWPLFAVELTRLPGGIDRLHLSIDLLIADGRGLQILFRDLARAYAGTPLPPVELSFRDYVVWRTALDVEEDRSYWLDRLSNLPPAPALPYTQPLAQVSAQRFQRLVRTLGPAEWESLQRACAQRGLTPSALMLAAFAETLALWAQRSELTLTVTAFNRLLTHADIDEVVGDFTSISLLPFDLTDALSLEERARRAQQQLLSDLAHSRTGVLEVSKTLRREAEHPELYPVVFTSFLAHGELVDPSDLAGFPTICGSPHALTQTPQAALDHQVLESNGALRIHWDTREDVFPPGLLEDMFDAYVGLLRTVAHEPERLSQPVPVSAPERDLATRRALNAMAGPAPEHLLHELVFEQAERHPAALAVVSGDERLSYGVLALHARRLAVRLQRHGPLVTDELVAVVMDKGWEQVVAVLAVLQAGGAYLPIAADLPASRRHELLELGRVRRVLTQPTERESAWPTGLDVIVVGLDEPWAQVDDAPQPAERRASDLAYVIYTSGSTGRPKGVAIEHRSAVNTIVDINERFAVGPGDRVLGISSLSFDLSVWDIFGVLGAGGTLVLPQRARDAEHWVELLDAEGITIWNTVPALLSLLVAHARGRAGIVPDTLRLALLSGDWIPVSLPDALRALVPACHVESLGGATEASIWSISYPIDEVSPEWTSIPYGRPLRNQRWYVLDEHLRSRPTWIPGELYIGGSGLAREYYGDPERTAERFITHPETGERLYRTGDLGRWLPDGTIEFMGRDDHQVKVGGYRIELGEIAWQLEQHPGVQAACVDTVGDRREATQLAAYVVPRPLESPPYGGLSDSARRSAFRFGTGWRPTGEQRFALPTGDELPSPWRRKSYRVFATDRSLSRAAVEDMLATGPATAVEAASWSVCRLADWLAVLRPQTRDGLALPKYHYASAGNLYAAYVLLDLPQGWEQLGPGCYAYDREGHELVRLADARGEVPTLHLIGDLARIRPIYGEIAESLCWLDGGYLLEALHARAASLGGRLCSAEPDPSRAELVGPDALCLAALQLGSGPALPTHEPGRDWELRAVARAPLGDLPPGTYRFAHAHDAFEPADDIPVHEVGFAGSELLDAAAPLALFLVGERGPQSWLRIGRLGQRWLERAPELGVGLCPIGWVDRDALSGTSVIHAFLAGPIAPAQAAAEAPSLRPALPEALRHWLTTRLPGYMVPTFVVSLDHLPLTANGKVDRAALPDPIPATPGQPSPRAVPSASELRARLATLSEPERITLLTEVAREEAADVLGLPGPAAIPAEQTLQILGLDSLKAIGLRNQLVARLEIELPIVLVFDHPTPAGLARQLLDRLGSRTGTSSSTVLPDLVPQPDARHEPFPLMPIQEAYWVGRRSLMPLGGVGGHVYVELDVRGLELERLQRALDCTIARHPMLRSVVTADGHLQTMGEPPRLMIPCHDVRMLESTAAEARALELRERLAHRTYDPQQWPMFTIEVTRLPTGADRLHLSADLLIADGRALQILFHDLVRAYDERPLPPLELTFRDYVLWSRNLDTEDDRAYWRSRLAQLPPAPALPYTRPLAHVTGQRTQRLLRIVPPGEWNLFQAACQERDLTPSSVALAIFAETLGAWVPDPEFTLNVTFFNRLPAHPQVYEVVGDFASISLVPIDMAAELDLDQRARDLQRLLLQDLAHSSVGAIEVLSSIRQESQRHELFPVVFTSFLAHGSVIESAELRGFPTILGVPAVRTRTPQVTIDYQILEQGGALWMSWDVVEGLFPPGLPDTMLDAQLELLRRLAHEPTAWNEVPRVVPEHDLAVRTTSNQTDGPIPEHLLHEPILEQARKRPEALAVIDGHVRLSYEELVCRARRLARRLMASGDIAVDEPIAVAMHKGWEQFVAVLAVLEAGGAYYPVAADLPDLRRRELLTRGHVRRVLTQADYRGESWPTGLDVIVVAEDEPWNMLSDAALPRVRGLRDLAYILFTSGSTGRPKGVAIEHRSVANTMADINDRFDVGPSDRVLGLAAMSFDLSVWDIFGTLSAGATLVLPQHERDPSHWAECLREHGVTIWNSAPGTLQMLVEYAEGISGALPKTLRLAMLGGDWIPLSLPDRLRALVPACRVQSMGGPTETSIFSISYPIGDIAPDWKSIPYGKPLRNHRYHVFDDRLRHRPTGVTGELYAAGIGLARGYYEDPERTAERFIVHPRTGERMFRTGDLGRWHPDGTIEFMGRNDHQVKLRGYRIELGEIAWQLEQHIGVQAACVDTVGDPRDATQLAAYVVPSSSEHPSPTSELLRAWLAARLPSYMVPTFFVSLEQLPLTINGKVNRAALPDPRPASTESFVVDFPAGLVPEDVRQRLEDLPRSACLELLTEVIQQEVARVLHLASPSVVPVTQPLQLLGLDSLKAVTLRNQLAPFVEGEVPIVLVFDHPTPVALAERLLERVNTEGSAMDRSKASAGEVLVGQMGPWLRRLSPSRPGRPRLYTMPYGGAGPLVFRPWVEQLPEMEVWGLTLPGREVLRLAPLVTDLPRVLQRLEHEILDDPPDGFILYGHSLGAIVAYELAARLERVHGISPDALVVAASPAPQCGNQYQIRSDSSAEEVLAQLAEITPHDAPWTSDRELLDAVLPALRADLVLLTNYRHDPATPPLACPIVAWGGAADASVQRSLLIPWAELTRGPFCYRTWPGEHLFLDHPELPPAIARLLNELSPNTI